MPLPKPKAGESQDDFISRCMSSEVMAKDFPDQDQRSAVCFQQWEQRNNRRSSEASTGFIAINARADTEAIRSETFQGAEHLVVPVVALVEGVLWPSNAPAPELALAEEFGQHPASWDGRPVLLDHPKRGGTPVSANRPDVLEEEVFGQLFNTKLEGKKLKTEAWINLDRVAEIAEERPEVQKTVDRIQAGELVEVSTGLFMTLEEIEGVYKGEAFNGIWRDVKSDHLALLPEGTIGACSVADGCGTPRTQSVRGDQMPPEHPGLCEKCQEVQASAEEVSALKTLVSRVRNLFQFRSNQQGELSDRDIRHAIEAALTSEGEDFFWVVAVFSDMFVYESGFSGTLLSRGFSISEDGTVTLAEEKVPVRPVTEFVPIKVGTEEDSMPTDNSDTTNNTQDLPEVSQTPEAPTQPPPAPEPAPLPVAASGGETQEVPRQPRTASEYVAEAPPEIREVLEEGLRMQQKEKESLVAQLRDNSRCEFGEDELKGMQLSMLRRLARLAAIPDYSARGGHTLTDNARGEDELQAPEPPRVFPRKAVGE